MNIKKLAGSGDKIGLLTLPFLVIGLILNITLPAIFYVKLSPLLKTISIIILIPGVIIWVWTAALILIQVPRNKLITSGPFALVKHPLYVNMALLVAPWVGFLLHSWLGLLIGAVVYVGSRLYSPLEEAALAKTFGAAWDEYCKKVKLPWL